MIDQKTGHELGEKKITLVSLLTLPGLELSHQPLSLKNSGPESKLIVSIRLKVMVPGQPMDDGHKNEEPVADSPAEPIPPKAPLKHSQSHDLAHETAAKEVPKPSTSSDHGNKLETNHPVKLPSIPSLDQAVSSTIAPILSASKISLDRESSIRRRKGALPPGVVSQVQLTLRYSSQRQRLVVVVHKVWYIAS